MKIFIRNGFFFFLTAIVLLLTAACVEEKDEPSVETDAGNYITYGPFNLGAKLDVKDEQVWMPNYNTGKVSQMLLKFAGDRTIDVIVIEYTNVSPYRNFIKVGKGEIKKGILEFSVKETDIKSNLLDGDDLLNYYFNEWYVDVNSHIAITPKTVKGNVITFVSLYDSNAEPVPAEGVIREGFSGASNSLTGDYIYYIYVDADCAISAEEVKNTDLKYTFNKLDLSLKSGWNTVLKSETYTTVGDSSYSMEVKNPSIKWVMQKIKSN